MRKLVLIAGLAALMSVEAAAADAQTRCERARSDKRVAGTLAGGLLGALAGSAIAGNSSNTAGVIVGGAAGAVAGNQLAKGKPCPRGYVRRSYRSTNTRAATSRCHWENRSYRDNYGNLVHRQVEVCR